ncbi:MAG TPA: AsmA family protein [Candidatus Eremiobacteraceae bacterium]|nr:AsmA family protein [Candidatus Eremiobacteraceae bacterium]
MSRLRKYATRTVVVVLALIGVQLGVSLLVRTHRMQSYLTAHLERAFGRPVQVGHFSVQILPVPELDVDAVTIGEDPGFGNEYFLRAEQMAARFRWLGLLRGHLEFGTMSFSRPSLILVRNADGHWNLERWLPPARPAILGGVSPRQSRAEPTYRLQKIDFDEGRINFKQGDEKRPFALTNVSGSVEQVSPGRWQLRLEAQPWRSGVPLQSTGTLQVMGFVAGTSARLQPAEIRLHWGKASLADLFRLVTGNDSGVRGVFALDGSASVGTGMTNPDAVASTWRFELQGRATQVHRWDLVERDDNPQVNVQLTGLWELAANQARVQQLRIDLPHSNFSGSAILQTSGPSGWEARLDTMAVAAPDLLAWYRAFQPNVADRIVITDQLTGSLAVSGWPLRWREGKIESSSGSLRLPGILSARLEPFRASVVNGKFHFDGVHVSLSETSVPKSPSARPANAPENSVEAELTQDSVGHQGSLRLNLHLIDTTPVFQLTSAFGHPVSKGWEYTGPASGELVWNWGSSLADVRRSGSLELNRARLQVAGLNEPLRIEDTRLEWKNGVRSAVLAKVDAFGATWSGAFSELPGNARSEGTNWRFQLHADHLDATELDRWMGPRSRPNWLQRLLASLLGNADAAHPSELLRRVSAEGEITADTFTIEKIKLAKAHATVALHGLHLGIEDGVAQWAGGTVHAGMQALFSPLPKYQVTADVENVNLAQLPWSPRWGERWSGLASGKLHLNTGGVGREELLEQLAGTGDVKLSKIEFRGWDVELSAESGGPSTGASRWTSGEGAFQLSEQQVRLAGFRLDGPHLRTQLNGTISFGMDGNLTFSPAPRTAAGTHMVAQPRELRVSGQLENPQVAVLPAGVEQTRP